MSPLTAPPRSGPGTFLGSPLHTDLATLDAHVAILGRPYGGAYGMRGVGSACDGEVAAARAYGAEIVTAYEVHEQGVASVLARIPVAVLTI